MKTGILDIGTQKISCFIVDIVKNKEPIILGVGHHQSNGVSSGSIIAVKVSESLAPYGSVTVHIKLC